MNTGKSQAQLRKGALELCVLRVLAHGEAYTSDITDALKQAELLVVEGTLYPLLSRLKNSGLCAYRWEESKSGPPRKYYSLTPTGQAYLSELNDEWERLVTSIEQLKSDELNS
jgi:PadR family transcriptional regulator PadR